MGYSSNITVIFVPVLTVLQIVMISADVCELSGKEQVNDLWIIYDQSMYCNHLSNQVEVQVCRRERK